MAGEVLREMYFIKHGSVALLDSEGIRTLILDQGSFFGEVRVFCRGIG